MNCSAWRRIELLTFKVARARLSSEELACPMCIAKKREYFSAPREHRTPALGPCYLHVQERDALYVGAR